MKRILVWDLPVRIFHWILAGSFVAAFLIANTVDDESPTFAIHMYLGGVMAFMIVLRLVWGFIGTRWAQFRSFTARPVALIAYLRSIVTGGEKRFTGHNPGSSLAAIVMFILILGLAVTGVLMARGTGEVVREIHELCAWLMILTVAAHLAGIAWYTLRHRENIAFSMISGRKSGDPAGAIPGPRPVSGLIFLALTGLWAFGLLNGYDSVTGKVTIPLTGQVLQVVEGAEHEAESGEAEEHNEHERGEHD